MACSNCTEWECITAYVNPCDEGIPTGLTAPSDGQYTVLLAFTNSTHKFILSMAADDEIVLPNEINNSFIYEMQVIDPNGDYLNDTCYKLQTILTTGSGNSIQPSPQPGASKIIVVDEDGSTFTNSFFATHTILALSTDSQTYLRDVGFTQSGSTITAIQFTFYNGQTLFAQA